MLCFHESQDALTLLPLSLELGRQNPACKRQTPNKTATRQLTLLAVIVIGSLSWRLLRVLAFGELHRCTGFRRIKQVVYPDKTARSDVFPFRLPAMTRFAPEERLAGESKRESRVFKKLVPKSPSFTCRHSLIKGAGRLTSGELGIPQVFDYYTLLTSLCLS